MQKYFERKGIVMMSLTDYYDGQTQTFFHTDTLLEHGIFINWIAKEDPIEEQLRSNVIYVCYENADARTMFSIYRKTKRGSPIVVYKLITVIVDFIHENLGNGNVTELLNEIGQTPVSAESFTLLSRTDETFELYNSAVFQRNIFDN